MGDKATHSYEAYRKNKITKTLRWLKVNKVKLKFQDLLKKGYPAYLQQKKYLKIRKIIMSSKYGNAAITKN